MTKLPLIKVLTDAGTGSRRRMADAIRQGKVEVNGIMAESFNHPVDPAKDTVYLNGQKLNLKAEQVVCLMLNKPEGIVSTASDEKGRPTVLELLPAKYKKHRLFPVGRLDIDTTGLLLLTNDGDLTYRLTHPRFEQEKEYLVRVEDKLNRDELQRLERGILLEDGMTAPAVVKPLMSGDYNYRIIIHEGKKRQVRRMFEHLGHPVQALKRVRIGTLRIGELEEGTVRSLTGRELKELTHSARAPGPEKSAKAPVSAAGKFAAKPATRPSTRTGTRPVNRTSTRPSASTSLSTRPANSPFGRPSRKPAASTPGRPAKRPPYSLATPNPRPAPRKNARPGGTPTGTARRKPQTGPSSHSAKHPPRFSKRKRV